MKKNYKVCVFGLGYVGIPLLVELSKKFSVCGFDKSIIKIDNLKKGFDETNQYKKNDLKNIHCTTDPNIIKQSEFIIVCIPTPVNNKNKPDLSLLKKATKTIGKNLTKNSVVIFESTVYPGVTEDICLEILKKSTNLMWKKDFNIGYSPERVNPGDKINTLKNIAKIVSADSKSTLLRISKLYKSIIKKIYPVSNIKVAEASKVIENTQRDVNIGLINEFSLILKDLNLDAREVLKAAQTKWNFLKFEPGLVGGHCIGIDPYYLAYVAKSTSIKPKVILSARNINEFMVDKLIARIKKKINKKKKLLIFGLTFKEDCPDLRNSKNLELAQKLIKSGYNVAINDELSDKSIIKKLSINKNFINFDKLKNKKFDMVLILVKHKYILKLNNNFIIRLLNSNGIIYDFKNVLKLKNKKVLKKHNISYLNF